MSKLWAVVPAAGIGARMSAKVAKQYLTLTDRTVIECTLQKLLAIADIQAVVVAVQPDDPIWPTLSISQDPRIITAHGGAQRSDSVINGLRALSSLAKGNDWVLVHDAARPCVTVANINAMIEQLADHITGGILSIPVADTLKLAADCQPVVVDRTVDRARMWAAQTPQMFRYQILLQALLEARQQGFVVTDEASAMENAGYAPVLITGRSDNIKITTPDDFALAQWIFNNQRDSTKS